jgi:hypothetical protein
MSRTPDEPRFIFHGNAMPFGGRIEAVNDKPHFELIKGPPAAALPVVGGWSIATSSGSCCHDWIKWGATVADCKGERTGQQSYVTTVLSSIADVYVKNDPHVFDARQIKIRMVSEHGAPGVQPKIVPAEIVFEGVRLDGDPITVPFDDDLARFPTFAEFEQEYQNNQSFFDKYQACLKFPAGETGVFGGRLPRTRRGYVLATFVRSVVWRGQTFPGNVLSLKGFGNIYFGEVLCNEDNRRVTMVRLALGCAIQAVAAFGEVDHNGGY